MRFTGPQLQEVADALIEAFDLPQLDQLLLYRLDLQRPRMALGDDYETIVFRLLQHLNARNGVVRLIAAARASNPDNPALFSVAHRHGLTMTAAPDSALERVIVESSSFIDISRWLSRLGRIERQVCRIDCIAPGGGTTYGTGFLVGPRAVLTNHHVVQAAIEGGISASRIIARFDYRLLNDGTLDDARAVGLDPAQPVLDWSPASKADYLQMPELAPRPDELDYALLRLNEPVGALPIGSSSEPGSTRRGWIDLTTHSTAYAEGGAIAIVQHPSAAPLKLAFESRSLIGLDGSGTRLRYRTNTEPGSSGSPCFTADLDLIALHHSGDPNFSLKQSPQYNQGIPISALMLLLNQRGVLSDVLAA